MTKFRRRIRGALDRSASSAFSRSCRRRGACATVSGDRGHGGVEPPIVLFHFAPRRGKAHPLKLPAGYQGRFVQCDAYQSCNAMTEIARDNGPW